MSERSETPPVAPSWGLQTAVVGAVILVRAILGTQPHSGQDNHHGATDQTGAYGGDYEAQRHWMELTVHVPMGADWYYTDLDYWGLDYPPLSAYQSWVCGKLSEWLVGSESVAWQTSRYGNYYNPAVHKALLRATVIAFDMLCYGTAAWMWTSKGRPQQPSYKSLQQFAIVMLQPSILLIDHGHFQYNTAALGLALWAFYCFPRPDWLWPVAGSIFFCCALSFKQMTLYYAPAVFSYLLGRCFRHGLSYRERVRRFFLLGVTVVATFLVTWWPIVAFGPANTTPLERLLHILRRIFPLQRGLFEGKVANLWCALSVRPFRIRQRLPTAWQPLAALLLTFGMILPACAKLFTIGRQRMASAPSLRHHQRSLLWGVTNTALAFFLVSFQVHEKSLLMAVAPLTLLGLFGDDNFVNWFSLVATWTLWPLLVLDRLQVAYVCTTVLFLSLRIGLSELQSEQEMQVDKGIFVQRQCHTWELLTWIPALTTLVTVGLHVAEAFWEPPNTIPDLFPVLWSVVGCGLCIFAWMVSVWELYRSENHVKEKTS